VEWGTATIWDRIEWASQVAEGVGIIFAVAAIGISIWSFKKQSMAESYRQLDEFYADIQAQALQDPRLASPDAHADDAAFMSKYDIYGFMVWNFIETISDRCEGSGKLCETWQPTLEYEGVMHSAWFRRNHGRFKSSFVKRMRAGGVSHAGNNRAELIKALAGDA